MLKGLNEKLEKILRDYCEDESTTEWKDVMFVMTHSVAAGDMWHVPVEMIPEGMNETDYADGQLLGNLPMFVKRTIINDGNERYCAFTSSERVRTGDSKDPVMTVAYPSNVFLEEIARDDNINGFVLNPWSDDLTLDAETVNSLLRIAARVPEDYLRGYRAYQIEPKAIIDTEKILEEWGGGWDDQCDKEEKWELKSYPIMADGRILLLFEMRDELYTEKSLTEATHRFSHYRVLEYKLEDGNLNQIGKYRFMAQDAHVGTVYLYDGRLNAAICPMDGETYSILPMVPKNDDGQFEIFENVRTMLTDSKREVIVAYKRNLLDKTRLPLLVFDEDGKIRSRYRNDYAHACADVNIDCEENIWLHMFPSSSVVMLDRTSNSVETHRVELQDFDTMALNDDRSKLFVAFCEHEGGASFYVMTRDENGDYGKPIRFEFLPETENDKKKEIAEYDDYGHPSAMKSWVLIKGNAKLYLYDMNDL